jgi:DnaK suppressor protein
MLKSEKKHLINTIQKKLEEIAIDIDQLKEVSKPVEPSNSLGRISRMDAIQSMNINKALLKTKQEEQVNLLKTLELSEEDHFGVCAKCKKDIPIQRLMRIPESKLCVPCIREINGT